MEKRTPGRRFFKIGLAAALVSLMYGCVSVAPGTPSASNAEVAGASTGNGASIGPDVTVGPSKTKKPKHPPKSSTTTATDEPSTQPTDTTAPTDTGTTSATDAPTDTPPAPTGSGGLHLRSIPINLFSFVILQPKLDYAASPNYGEANLSSGFSPDPYSVGMTTGGNVDVSYLGSACSGFATSHPDLRINFAGSGASLLRLYFVGNNGDSTMVINDPYGNFYCVDDSFGTANPTIDYDNPPSGSYDVWIGSYAANTTISGTMYLTENSGDHP